MHPLAILLALKTYAQGRGEKGKLPGSLRRRSIDALNAAFYTAFATIEATGKRIMLALDVSGSMAAGGIAGTSLSPREGSAAMALMTAATEENYHIVGFTAVDPSQGYSQGAKLTPLPLTPGMRLDDAVRAVANLPFGETDCALPMLHALEQGLSVDAFVVYTDSETLGRQDPAGAGAARVPPPDRHRGEARRRGHGFERLLHRRPERWRHAGCGRLRRRRAGANRRLHPRVIRSVRMVPLSNLRFPNGC